MVNELKSPQKRASLIVGTNILLPKLDTDSDGKKKEMSLIERVIFKYRIYKKFLNFFAEIDQFLIVIFMLSAFKNFV